MNALLVSKYMSETRPFLGLYPIERIAALFSLSHYLVFGCSHSLAVGRVLDNSSVLHKHFYFKETACLYPTGIISSQMSNFVQHL